MPRHALFPYISPFWSRTRLAGHRRYSCALGVVSVMLVLGLGAWLTGVEVHPLLVPLGMLTLLLAISGLLGSEVASD